MEVAAGKIMAQLARRAILVTDVEVYEFTKKKINYSETPTGIKLKNRVFKFDDGAVLQAEDQSSDNEVQQQLMELLQSNPHLANSLLQQKPNPTVQNPSLVSASGNRMEYFCAENGTIQELKQAGTYMTLNKKYEILHEVDNGGPQVFYTVKDDHGKQVNLHVSYFSTKLAKVQYNNIVDDGPGDGDINLDFGHSYVNEDIPNLR